MPMRFDLGELKKPVRTKAGFLRVDALISRTGVFLYRNPDGSTRRELRLPEEVFRPDSLESFSLSPLTLGHPSEPVTVDNAKRYSVGTIGEQVSPDGKFLRTTVQITDKRAIEAVERGDARQLSCGYECDLEPAEGSFNGERYDAIQRNIRGNHVAIVREGRAGAEVRLQMDEADHAVQVATDQHPTESITGVQIMKKEQKGEKVRVLARIDGAEYKLKPEVAAALERADTKAKAEIAKLKADLADATKAADEAKSRADAAEKGVKAGTDKALADARARVALEAKAAPILGESVKLDELDEVGIKRAVAEKLSGVKLDGKDAAYVSARFDHAMELEADKAAKAAAAAKGKNAAAAVRGAVGAGRADAGTTPDVKASREAYKAAMRDQWKTTPGTQTKQ